MYTSSNNHHAGSQAAPAPGPGYGAYPPPMYYPHGHGPQHQHYQVPPHGHGHGPPPPQNYPPPHNNGQPHGHGQSPSNPSPSSIPPPHQHQHQHHMYQHQQHPYPMHPTASQGHPPPQAHDHERPEGSNSNSNDSDRDAQENVEGSAEYHDEPTSVSGVVSNSNDHEEGSSFYPEEGERNEREQGEEAKAPMAPYYPHSQHMPPNVAHDMPAYPHQQQGHPHHAHAPYPTHQHQQHPPYYHPSHPYPPPPETWNAANHNQHPRGPPIYVPHTNGDPLSNPNNLPVPPPYPYHGHYPGYPPSSASMAHNNTSPERANGFIKGKKRKGPGGPPNDSPTHSYNSHNGHPLQPQPQPNKQPKFLHQHNPRQLPSASSTSPPVPSFHSTKSVRRKKKMYSDFVGVTYNKTHAKYQACITHYRKQHYLGRYKLAVDAALAYDESARLLKGASWKVNFPTKQAYEDAKIKELATLGKNGGATVDVAGSLAAVASKVEEIATSVGQGGGKGARSEFYRGVIRDGTVSQRPMMVAQVQAHVGHGGTYSFGKVVPTGGGMGSITQQQHQQQQHDGKRLKQRLTPHEMAVPTPAMSKVTPSPSFPIGSPVPEKHKSPPASSSLFANRNLKSIEQTPLNASPNPTRHALGVEKNTPDSVIRPMVLTYKGGHIPVPDVAVGNSPLAAKSLLNGSDTTSPQQNEKEPGQNRNGVTTVSTPGSLRKLKPPIPPTNGQVKKEVNSVEKASPRDKPPVIQNGTLAAASALMTLFGNEKSPTKD